MDLLKIKNFLTLANELHFWNASTKLNITQSALSRQIQSMEEELGIQLFERTKRTVKLTPAGEFLKVKWTVVLDEFNLTRQYAKKIEKGESGCIRISQPDSISFSIIPELLSRMSAHYPELKVELLQLTYDDEQEFLTRYKIDLKFSRHLNRLPNISSMTLQSDHFALVVPDNHVFKSFDDISRQALKEQKFILPSPQRNSSFSQDTDRLFEYYGIVPDVSYYSVFGSVMISLISNQLGVGIMPYSYVNHRHPGVRFIKLPFECNLFVHWRTDDMNPILKNILKMIEELPSKEIS